MDNILEILIPLIFAAIYFFGNMFTGKKEEEDAPPAMPRRSNGGDEDDAADRQRRIQEEIRRKIMARRQANSGDGQRTQPVPEVLRPRREVAERTPEVREYAREETSPPQPIFESKGKDSPFSWDRSDNAYDKSMDARLRQIEATKRQAAKLQSQANAAHMKNDGGAGAKRRQRKSGGYFSGSVRESLGDPAAARAAFIYGEVLGRPIGLRSASDSNVPGLSQ